MLGSEGVCLSSYIKYFLEIDEKLISWQLVAIVKWPKTTQSGVSQPKIKGKIRLNGKYNFLLAVVYDFCPGMVYT